MQNDIKMSLQTQDKLAGNENLPIVKTESKVGIVRQLPISERMIYHGRNWVIKYVSILNILSLIF